jgi:hypothetical protein
MVYSKLAFLLILLLPFPENVSGQQNRISITKAAKTFLGSLSVDEVKKTQFQFEDSLRLKWTNLPVGLVPRPGIQYGSLSDDSRLAFHELLSTILSSQGYLKLTSIMQLDDILNVLYQSYFDQGKIPANVLKQIQGLKWDHGNYYISLWGEPDEKNLWGLNFGGHHIALSLTVSGNAVSFSPLFIGTDPAQVKSGKYAGWRILSKEEDYGFLLLDFLTKEQKTKAILSRKIPEDIITNPKSIQRIDDYYGLPAKELTGDQKAVLKMLIEEYVHNFDHVLAHQLYDKILKTGLDKIYFAWIGNEERNRPHYYVINGPDFLIEYDNVGFQNDGNHIHAILRTKGNDFGNDMLKEHYLKSDHHRNQIKK